MWMLNGITSGLLLFGVLFALYFVQHVAGGLRSNSAISISAIIGKHHLPHVLAGTCASRCRVNLSPFLITASCRSRSPKVIG